MYKLRFSEPIFHSCNNGKVITCTYNCWYISTSDKSIKYAFKVSGKAYCNPNDVNDAKKGKAIADSRAKEEAYTKALIESCKVPINFTFNKAMTREICEERINELKNTISQLNMYKDYIAKLVYLVTDERKHINDLIYA